MHTTGIVQHIKEAKQQKKMTLQEIANHSKIAIRTVNKMFARKDVRFSSLRGVLETLDLPLCLQRVSSESIKMRTIMRLKQQEVSVRVPRL